MKQILLKSWLMLCLLFVGIGTTWAETYTITFKTSSSDGSTTIAANANLDNVISSGQEYVKAFTSSCSKAYYASINGIKLGSSSATGTVEFSLADALSSIQFKTIKVVSAKYGSDTGTLTLYNGSTELKKGITPGEDYTYTYANPQTISTIKLSTSAKRAYVTSITLSTEEGTTPDPTPTTYTVTIDNNIANGSVTASTTSATAGTTVNLTATPSTGYEFGSWNVTGATVANNTSATTSFTMPAADVNVSATFNAIQGGGDEPGGDETTVTWIASEQGYTNGTQYTSANVDENISLAFGDGANDGKYYTTGSGIRLYSNGKLTVSAANGATISSIVITYSATDYTGTFTASTGEYRLSSATGTWTGSANSVVLTNTASSGHARIQKIAVTYAAEGGETPEPEKTTPTLSFASATATAYLDALSLFVAPTLTTDPENLTGVTYKMTGDAVGSINSSTGVLTLTAAGTATITASYAGDGKNYNAAEDASYTLTVNANAPEKTIAEFIASEGGICYLTGTVSNIKSTTYGNFDLTDETGTIYVYGCLTPEGQKQQFNTLDVVAGDKIKVLANEYTVFNETKEVVNVIFVEEIEIEKTKYTVTIETPENGTLVVKDGETVLASGDQVEEGNTITIECTPTDAENYRYKNWQYKEDGNWITNTTTMTRVVTKDISIRANFEEIPVYTVAFSVNGVEVQSENLKDGADVTIPADPEAINSKVFTGWVTTSTVDADATPAYVTPSTTATEDVTYYAVFATQTGSAGGEVTEELTNAEVTSLSSSKALAYATEKTYTDGTVNYSIYAYTDNTSRKWMQLKKDQGVYVKMTAPAPIKNVEVTLTSPTNSSGGINDITKHTAYSGYVALCESDCAYTSSSASVASTNTITNNVATLEPTGDNTELYLKVSTGARIWGISVTYGEPASYSDFTTIPEVTFTSAGTINFVANDGEGNYYATFSSDKITAFPTNPSDDVILNVESVYINGDGTITKYDFEDDYTSVNDDMDKVIIPANTGVLLHVFTTEDTAPSVSYEYTNAESEIGEYVPEFNMLVPCTTTGIYKSDADENYYYKLAYGDNTKKTKLGFWWGAADGSGNFKVKAGGAILCVPQGAGVKGFSFDEVEDATAIEEVEVANSNDAIYNIAGQRIKATHNATGLRRGLYIVNGKKVMVK